MVRTVHFLQVSSLGKREEVQTQIRLRVHLLSRFGPMPEKVIHGVILWKIPLYFLETFFSRSCCLFLIRTKVLPHSGFISMNSSYTSFHKRLWTLDEEALSFSNRGPHRNRRSFVSFWPTCWLWLFSRFYRRDVCVVVLSTCCWRSIKWRTGRNEKWPWRRRTIWPFHCHHVERYTHTEWYIFTTKEKNIVK